MFAVKGWSVSADNLKPEAGGGPKDTPAKKSRKRKRASQPENVTSSNVADMWEKVIDHKEEPPKNAAKPEKSKAKETETQSEKGKKRQKLNSGDAKSEKDSDSELPSTKKGGKQEQDAADRDGKSSKKDKKEKKDKKKGKKDKQAPKETDDTPAKKDTATTKAVAAVPAPPKLTPLQASMREKLISARFRHLNETLYTRPSAEAFNLFKESPEMFTEYHEGFRRQVEVWPQNPVEGFLAEIRRRARQRHPSKNQHRGGGKGDTAGGPAGADVQPLPRNRATNVCTIADLGCGDAQIASDLQREKGKLKLEVLSFDLHSPHPLVTKADIANLPLANGSVDVAIFCLALMGTNWVDFVEEAYRVLRWKGELWVAEIKSRLGGGMKKGGGGGVVEHSVGNRRKAGAGAPAPKKGAAKKEAEAANEAALLVEVDGEDDTRQQTDVSAFVEVLNKRGFMLQGQDQGRGSDAVDLSNKMFVTMRFVKSAPAVKGKCAQKEEDRDRLSGKPAFLKKPKFIDDQSKDVNEAAVLKPCVYKIR